MTVVSADVVQTQLAWRYATKKFDPTRRIPDADWQVLEQSLVLTPSSFGLQPWRFIVVTDPAVKAQMPAMSWGQTQPHECSHMVVFAIKKNVDATYIDRFVARTAEVQGKPIESLAGFRKMMVGYLTRDGFPIDEWATRQVYISLGQFMGCAALMGIDSCPMEGIDPARYDELLGLPEQGFATVVACAVGYRTPDDKYASIPKVRFKAEDVVQRV